MERDLQQIPFITQRSIDRDVTLKASELLLDPHNVVVVNNQVGSDQPEEFYLINSTRNLAQNGINNKITKNSAKEFLKVQYGVSVVTMLRRIQSEIQWRYAKIVRHD